MFLELCIAQAHGLIKVLRFDGLRDLVSKSDSIQQGLSNDLVLYDADYRARNLWSGLEHGIDSFDALKRGKHAVVCTC